jgi:hypothetical protein
MVGHFCSFHQKAVNCKTYKNRVHYYQQDGKNVNSQDFSLSPLKAKIIYFIATSISVTKTGSMI